MKTHSHYFARISKITFALMEILMVGLLLFQFAQANVVATAQEFIPESQGLEPAVEQPVVSPEMPLDLANFVFLENPKLISPGEAFSQVLSIESGTQLVDYAAAYLNFNVADLQVVSVTPDLSELPNTSVDNYYSNENGTIDYAAGTDGEGVSGDIDLVSIQFQAQTGFCGTTSIRFNNIDPRRSDIQNDTVSYLGSTPDGVINVKPGSLTKTAPVNNDDGLSTSPTLSWAASECATEYEYCYDTSVSECTNWTSTGTNTQVTLNNLAASTTYYWHVRAKNSYDFTYSDGDATTLWSFTTGDLPAAFSKTAPANGATGQPLSLTLDWEESTGATSYEYCYATSASECITWTNTGPTTQASLTGLAASTTYYWHVRAINDFGTTPSNADTLWSFTTGNPPAAFSKISPTNGATGQSLTPTLDWEESTGATSYEYCYATSALACTNWTSTSTTTQASLSGLAASTTYYWHVRAINDFGTTPSNADTLWSFTTGNPPAAFSKISPTNGATGQSLTPTLDWEESTGATSYEYCYATSALACTTWTSTSTTSQASISGLAASTTYYWHVRAINDFGTTPSNTDTLWSFTTGSPPAAFSKTSPTNGAPDQILSPTLTWGASTGAVTYEYCYATSTGSCTNWTSTNLTTAGLTGLSASTTYYWHVRAINSFGITYSDGSSTAFWSFRTGDPPGAFVKTSPPDDATSQLLNVKLDWDASAGAVSYEYCIDTLNDNACSTWNSTGTATEIGLTGLDSATIYYWHVRAINAYGITYSNGSASAYWSFTTISAAPAAFSKTYPANNAKEVPLTISATWEATTGVEYYEYCLDTTNDSLCSTNWTSNGTSTQKLFGGLEPSTTYYWHVRAVNSLGTTYSNGSETAYWSFTTIHPWYLAEGYTGPGYGTFILIQNPNPETANVYIEYMPESGGVIARTHEVDPYSRYTIAAVLDVGENQAFSTRLTADRFIVVERAMYWPNGDGTSGGHVSSAIAFPKNTWYLAEGYTGDGFETFILIQNPNDVPANVSLTYMIEGGENVTREVIVAARSRFTVVTNYATQVGENAAFSTKLVSDQPVVVERAMYFNNEGHVVGGVTSPQNTWYLAEGYTGDGTETFILIQNPNATASDVTLTYMLQGGGVETRAVSVLANSRKTIRVNDVDQLGDGLAFSTKVTGTQPIIVERAMYWNNGVGSNAGHASTGVTTSATTWYLAEGYTGSGFSTYILIQNPNASSVNVTLTYMVDGGGTFVKTLTIPANSRYTVATQDASQMGLDAIFSTKITGNLPIIVERAMYFFSGGHNAAGVIPE